MLVKQAQQGEQQAIAGLVIRYQHKITTLLARYLAPKDVSDIAQETFIKAYSSPATFRAESSFYAWLYRITVNTAINHQIAQERHLPIGRAGDVYGVSYVENYGKLREIENSEQILLSEELLKAISQAIETLPKAWQSAITLCEIEGLSYE